MHDNDGRVLILDATINGSDYLLINFYNANTEREQLTAIKNLNNLLKDFEDFHDKKVIFASDFNLIFDKNLESSGGSPLLKKLSLSEIIKLNENFNLCDIWRVRNPHKKLSDKNISLVLYNEDLIIFSFLTVYRNQLKKQKF